MLLAQVSGFDSTCSARVHISFEGPIQTLFPPDNFRDVPNQDKVNRYQRSKCAVLVLCCTKVHNVLNPSLSLSNLQLIGKSSSKLPKQMLLRC